MAKSTIALLLCQITKFSSIAFFYIFCVNLAKTELWLTTLRMIRAWRRCGTAQKGLTTNGPA